MDPRSETLAALTSVGDNPLIRSFPEGAVFAWDHDLRYLSAGGQGLAEVGLSREIIEGRTIFEVFPPETALDIEPLYRAALEGRSTIVDIPFRDHVYSQHLAPVFDADGAIVAGMGFTQDVTQVRAAEAALRESEQRSRLSFENAPIGQALVELDGRWRHVNPALTRLTGYSEAELLKMTFQDITHPDDLEADLEQLALLLAGKIDTYQMEKRYITATGATVWVLLAVSLVRSADGAPLYFIAQIQDITDLKRQQEALQNLIAMLAHDLRSPLFAIAGFADLLTANWDRYPDPQRLELIERISVSSHAVGRLLENTLTVSAVDAGALRPSPAAVSVDEVIREAVALLPEAGAVDVTGVSPLTAWTDRTHLGQVITNLINNAVKYGGGPMTVTTEDGVDLARVHVSDHGPGVPPDFVPHLFERFTRSESARSARRGTGLGLYIVRSLLTANGGDVSYSETPGGGATFSVSLPKHGPQSDAVGQNAGEESPVRMAAQRRGAAYH